MQFYINIIIDFILSAALCSLELKVIGKDFTYQQFCACVLLGGVLIFLTRHTLISYDIANYNKKNKRSGK